MAVVEKNEPLVKHLVKFFLRAGVDRDELIQAGNYGLILAVQGYRAEAGVEFSTYASWCIKRQIREWISEMPVIHVPRRHSTNSAKGAKAKEMFRPFVEQASGTASLSDFPDDPTWVDDDPARIVEERDEAEHVKAIVDEVLGTLSDRERQIIESRCFDDEPLWRIGARMNRTKERIRQIESKAKGKLRENAALAACAGGVG